MARRNMLRAQEITVRDPFILHSFELEKRYLLSLSGERLLAGFRATAGLPAQAERYGGWESTEIQGHTMGHYLTALSQAWANCRDDRLMERIESVIDGLRQCQRADGFLFASPEELFDRVENRQPVWVPWYTMHKLVAGLVAVCRLTELDSARTVLSSLCSWITRRVLGWDEHTHQTVLSVEYGGMNDCLYDAYSILGSEAILRAAHRFDELPLFEAMAQKRDILNGLHANTTIPKILGGLKRFAVVDGCEPFYLEMAESFWDMVINHHTYLSGGNSEWEHFGLPDVLDAERTACNCETCNTHNMIKLSQLLFELTGKKKYAEYDAWAYVNTILSSQNHETGMTTYFQPMDTGFFKVYSRPFDQFWCCTGTGMENFSCTGSGIAYLDGDTLYLNRLISSDILHDDLCVSVRTEWNYSCRIALEVSAPSASYVIALRKPHWVSDVSFSVPEGIRCREENDYLLFSGFGTDKTGLSLEFAMELSRHGLPDCDNVFAYSFGPFMLSADMGCEQMDTDITGVDVTVPTRNIPVRDYFIDPTIVPSDKPLSFTLRSADGYELTLAPHFLKNQVRYGIYFREFEAGGIELTAYIEETERVRRAMKQFDVIPVGNDQYELSHHVRGEKTDSFADGIERGRVIFPGGYISYTMKTPDAPCRLHINYDGTAAVELNGKPVPAADVICIPEEMRCKDICLVIRNADASRNLRLFEEIYITGGLEDE